MIKKKQILYMELFFVHCKKQQHTQKKHLKWIQKCDFDVKTSGFSSAQSNQHYNETYGPSESDLMAWV